MDNVAQIIKISTLKWELVYNLVCEILRTADIKIKCSTLKNEGRECVDNLNWKKY